MKKSLSFFKNLANIRTGKFLGERVNVSRFLAYVRDVISTLEMLAGVMNAAGKLAVNGRQLKSAQVRSAFSNFAKVWDVMFPIERYRFIREVVRQVMVFPDKVKIEYNTQELEQVMLEVEEETR